jgi:dTMP kinase
MTTGVFITLEGGEGAGKSTQLKLLEERLVTHEINIVRTREPGGVPSAETIRDLLINGETDKWLPLTETLLHFAARHEHISRLVQPALERGQWVLCDRFADSTTAYQGYAQNIDLETIATLYGLAVGNLEPNLTIILDLPVEIGLERAEDRGLGGTRYEKMGIEFHKRLRDGFLQIAANNLHRCSIVDATQSIEEISENIMALVQERFLSTPSKGKRS